MSTRSVSGKNKIDLKHRLRVHHYEISQNCASMMTRGCQEAFTRVVKAKKTKKANKAIFFVCKISENCAIMQLGYKCGRGEAGLDSLSLLFTIPCTGRPHNSKLPPRAETQLFSNRGFLNFLKSSFQREPDWLVLKDLRFGWIQERRRRWGRRTQSWSRRPSTNSSPKHIVSAMEN